MNLKLLPVLGFICAVFCISVSADAFVIAKRGEKAVCVMSEACRRRILCIR